MMTNETLQMKAEAKLKDIQEEMKYQVLQGERLGWSYSTVEKMIDDLYNDARAVLAFATFDLNLYDLREYNDMLMNIQLYTQDVRRDATKELGGEKE